MRGDVILSAGDDGVVRLSDVRTFGAINSHRLKRICYAACADDERLFAGCDDGTIHMFDYSAPAAIALRAREEGGGFSTRQKQALSAAVEAARRRGAP